jgi:hypothetical protein
MPNTISSIWQFPSGSEYGDRLDQAATAEQNAVGSAPVAAELGIATTPIRENVAPIAEAQPEAPAPQEQYYTNTSEAIPTDRSAAVLDATRSVFDALDSPAAPAITPEVPHDPAHDQAAFERMRFYGPTLEAMRDSVLGA